MTAPVRPLTRRPDAAVRLFCLPYAGGGVSAYRDWAGELPDGIEPWALQPPGREDRHSTAPLERMDDLLNELVPALIPHLDRPFALFGHSMGALVAWEVARALEQLQAGTPLRLFVSGCLPPQVRSAPEPPLHTLPDAELTARLREWSGTPEAVLAEPELMTLLIPTIRADLAVAERHVYRPAPVLTCPVSVFGGTGDEDVDVRVLERWAEVTTGPTHCRLFAGGHFFLHTARTAVLREIAARLGTAPNVGTIPGRGRA